MTQAEKIIEEKLFSMQDKEYKKFNSALLPTVEDEKIIGIRTPILRKYAAEIAKTPLAAEFLSVLPHKYYEENNLHAFLLEKIKDYDEAVCEMDRFLPYVDNWATCDSMAPKIFAKNTDKFLEKIKKWISSNQTYTVRYGIGMLMRYYLDERFLPEYAAMVASVKSEEYYVNMMIAWYFATALAKEYEVAVKYLENGSLSTWIHNKTIQKACESYRVSDDKKQYLKTLKIKR